MKNHLVSIAFALDFLPNVENFRDDKGLTEQLKLVSADPGRVFIFFPAEKETSGLRFHLHAPFVPEPSRASIMACPANEPLFIQLAELAAESLHKIKALGLLSVDFLGVLPNHQDTLRADYEPIRKALTEAMNEQPLTPTYSRMHFPAKYLLQSRVALKELLSEEDIAFLFDYDDEPPRWAMSAPQKNSNTDRFLSGLAITKWDVTEFAQALFHKSLDVSFDEENAFAKWLSSKPIEWHQRLYALLYRESVSESDFDWLRDIRIVRLNNGSYEIGSKCFFPSSDNPACSAFLTVDIAVYSSGKSKQQQDDAKTFLQRKIGVQEVEVEHIVMAILNERYTAEAETPEQKDHVRDLRQFISFTEKNPERGAIFAEYHILKGAKGNWFTPNGLFIDSPYFHTDLNSYYRQFGENSPRRALSKDYLTYKLSIERLIKFVKTIGVQYRLSVEETPDGIANHPLCSELSQDLNYSKATVYGINEDWTLPELATVLEHPSEQVSKLIWSAMRNADAKVLTARYRPNRSCQIRVEDSSLVVLLRDKPWVPQKNGAFVKPARASRDLLPKGFPFDSGEEWLKAVYFGAEEEKRSEEHRKKESAAKEYGFKDADTFDRAKRIMEILSVEDQIKILSDLERKSQMELPEHESKNPEVRAARIAQLASKAPDRSTEKRLRSVAVGLTDVKQDAEQFLREQYMIDGEMICQICGDTLPFKLPNGQYYFETVEFLDADGLKQRHYQNYLALCPNHCAMFKHANGSKDMLKDMLAKLTANELEIILAKQDAKIYFTKMHLADLKTVLEVDKA